MSDIDEPAAKILKLEDLAEGEEMDNGQEEWLSEEILTDDDYNPAADQDHSDSNANTSQEEGNNDSIDQALQDVTNTMGENIERTLKDLDNATSNAQAELPEELGAFLIRKTDGRVVDGQRTKREPESELDESTKQSEDDGNDTDDLLRMLGEDNSKKKESSVSQTAQSVRAKEAPHSSDEDDDDYIFEGARLTRLKVSKNVLHSNENNAKFLKVAKGALIQQRTPSRTVPEKTDCHAQISKVSAVAKLKAVKLENKDVLRSRRIASKAVPEDMSDLDEDSVPNDPKSSVRKRGASSDEAMTVKRMFDVHQSKVITAGPRRRGINAVKTVTNRVVSIDTKNRVPSITSPATVKPPVKSPAKLLAKPSTGISILPTKPKRVALHNATSAVMNKSISLDDINDEEHLNDDMDSEAEEEGGLRLMRPERMDEEVPSDAESHTDDDSYYDEMPSSESDDADDWFTLDIRAERAAEYIPLLGEDAKALLTAEQQRAAARLGALRRSAGALVAGRRSLAAQLRTARTTIAQIDAALAQ